MPILLFFLFLFCVRFGKKTEREKRKEQRKKPTRKKFSAKEREERKQREKKREKKERKTNTRPRLSHPPRSPLPSFLSNHIHWYTLILHVQPPIRKPPMPLIKQKQRCSATPPPSSCDSHLHFSNTSTSISSQATTRQTTLPSFTSKTTALAAPATLPSLFQPQSNHSPTSLHLNDSRRRSHFLVLKFLRCTRPVG